MSGDEHPSGLRDAIAGASAAKAWPDSPEARNVEIVVRAWLSVVSEGEIAVVTKAVEAAISKEDGGVYSEHFDDDAFGIIAAAALAASRGVLVGRIESDAGTKSGDIGGQAT